MKLAGFVGCPADSCDEIKEIADYISAIKGGNGAVRDVICYILKGRGQWETAYKTAYKMGGV
jgi:3-deoxy-D-manno-octulosonate 8-phosphate phosphatase (KDO 8-P phosphatase)